MSDNEVFMQVKELGDLYLYDVLLSYIYPRVFVCEDIYDGKYLFYEVSSSENKDIWLVAKVTKKEYYDLVDRKKSIQKAYEDKTGFSMFSISKTYGDDEGRIELTLNAKEWVEKLPQDPVFAEKELIDDINEKTLEAARENGATTFDIRLFPGTDRHFIPQNILSDLCRDMTSLTNSIFGRRRSEVLRVATAPGSCIVRFSFPDQINLFNESDAIKEMDVINEVLASESITEGISKVKNQTGFIRSYSKILNTIRKTGSDVQFTTASPNSTTVQKIKLTKETVQDRFEDVKNVHNIEKETITIKGTLIALDIKSKRFKLQLDDGTIKSGVVTNEFLKTGSSELPKSYDAVIDIEKYIDKYHMSSKEKYCLKALLN